MLINILTIIKNVRNTTNAGITKKTNVNISDAVK